MTADTLLARLESGEAPAVLDVRARFEFRAGHVPGAVHVPFWHLPFVSLPAALDRDQPVALYCAYGPRAWMAGAALRARGFRHVTFVAGHMAGWRRRGLPEER